MKCQLLSKFSFLVTLLYVIAFFYNDIGFNPCLKASILDKNVAKAVFARADNHFINIRFIFALNETNLLFLLSILPLYLLYVRVGFRLSALHKVSV